MLKTFLQLYGTLVVRNLAYSTSTTAMAAHMRAVRIKSFGDPSQLYIEDQEPIPQLASNHDVLLHVAATALNRADTLQRKGGYNPPKGASDILGLEASGVIEKIGSNVQGFKEGDRVMALLAEQGVDIILDPVGGSNVDQNLASIAMDGRWVLYGLMGGPKASNDKFFALMLRKRVQLLSSTLRARSLDYKKDLVDSFENHALEKFVSGEYKPIIDSITTLDGVADAHRRMDANLNSGKIIMKVSDSLLAKDEL
uniref:Enoyl reductase (ER) domain-containing protein n=1 Tax=Clytia hemisphaerica TaxID=252671 RepID=A0A7M6DNF9_9CNID